MASELDQCNWWLESSTASTSYGCGSSTISMMGRPMLPTAAVLSPAAARIDSSICVVVVLPFVPVIPSHGTILSGRLSRQASSASLQIGMPRAAASRRSGVWADQPVAITRSASEGRVAVEPGPSRTKAPSTSNNFPRSEVRSSSTSSRIVTRVPKCSSPSAAAKPETPMPATTTCACGHGDWLSACANHPGLMAKPCNQMGGSEATSGPSQQRAGAKRPPAPAASCVGELCSWQMGGSEATSGPSGELCSCTGHPFRVEDAQPGGNEQPGNDPKAHHDCHLCPVEQLEVMVNGRHLEQPSATSQLEEADLENDRHHLDDEQSTQDHQEQLGSSE